MPEELMMLLAGLAKAAAEGKVEAAMLKDMPEDLQRVFRDAIEHREKMEEIASLSKELGDSIKNAVIVTAREFVKINNLPDEQFLDYVIYGAVANTLKFINDIDEDDDGCECDECKCNHHEQPESSEKDALLDAINALKDILSK
jgi:hypothetical protein